MTDPTRQVEPIDPRTVECPGCPSCIPTITEAYTAENRERERCHGTGRVPLRPTPTVAVVKRNDGYHWAHVTGNICGETLNAHGYDTPADAFRAARLAVLGARLRMWKGIDGQGEDYTVERETDGKPLATGPTPDAAIEAAFAARDASAAALASDPAGR